MRFEVVQKAKVKIEFVPEYGQSINPISRLIQIQQAKKEKEPVYTLIAEKGMPRRREFVMQVIMYSSWYYAFYSSRIFFGVSSPVFLNLNLKSWWHNLILKEHQNQCV